MFKYSSNEKGMVYYPNGIYPNGKSMVLETIVFWIGNFNFQDKKYSVKDTTSIKIGLMNYM